MADARAARAETPRFPDLERLERLGEGGMGTVFRAHQVSLDRTVAVKTLREDLLDDEDFRRRFEREARALARVAHPNVVPVFATGEHERRPYYVMRFIEGPTLERHLEGPPLPAPGPGPRDWRAVAEAFRKVALAVAAAHAAGVLHRDVKPENVLVDERGEPVVVDFGLAKRAAAGEESLSARDPVLGTPDYVAPEVAGGLAASELSDVYGLGATLYRVLAGRPPFEGGELLEKLRRIREADPALPRALRPDVPEPLQAICLRAMERAPADRYGGAAAMAEDLARFLAGEPVLARPTLYRSLLDRRLRAHRAGIEEWAREGLVTRRERDALLDGYERLEEGERDSIFEMERLSTRLVFLYVGALVVALGPAVLLALAWRSTPDAGPAGALAFRLAVTAAPLAGLLAAGRAIWRRGEFRTALPFLLGAALLAPSFFFVLAHEVPALRGAAAVEATLDRFELLARPEPGPAGALARTLDRKLLCVAAAWLAATLALRRATGSPAFIWVGIAAGLALFHFAAVAAGWRGIADHWRAASYLPAGLALAGAGWPFDRRGRRRDARPLYLVGFAVLALAWIAFAAQGYPLEWLGPWPRGERVPLSFVAGGAIALGLAFTAERGGTSLLLRYAVGPYVAAALGVLPSLSVLVRDRLELYEALLPAACLGFVALSVAVQRKNLLYSGAGYISIAVFQVTRNHFRDEWAWPIVVVATGATLMATAYLVPRIEGRLRRAAGDAARSSSS
jgi:tRNA A-37 threonylcarbamoyl transferase component Bud32